MWGHRKWVGGGRGWEVREKVLWKTKHKNARVTTKMRVPCNLLRGITPRSLSAPFLYSCPEAYDS